MLELKRNDKLDGWDILIDSEKYYLIHQRFFLFPYYNIFGYKEKQYLESNNNIAEFPNLSSALYFLKGHLILKYIDECTILKEKLQKAEYLKELSHNMSVDELIEE